MYKNEKFINTLGSLEKLRPQAQNVLKINFNDKKGWLGVRCVDTTNPNDMLKFAFKDEIKYDWENRIKGSSRLLTLINLDVPLNKRTEFIQKCNHVLKTIRNATSDIILSPFKGNMKNGRRRRRLDFYTCRAIIEKTYIEMGLLKKEIYVEEQLDLFKDFK